ncbi:MAG TPA: RNA-binding cell elongation regulator Jag/EloR [Elusimicrobiota bacterium]|jgi:spoIIIJ-associated protein|nr:RNA-binding cell elongation regulator Jag/EloR [Elusimicrobiota bacterium]
MQPIENEGRTVAEAVEGALKRSGLRRDQVEITVLDEGAPGFLGIGAKPARVRLTEKRWGPDSPAPEPAPAKPVSAPRPARPPRPAPPPPRPFIPAPTYVAPKPAPKPAAAPPPDPAPRREAPRPASARSESRAPRERDAQRPSFRPATPEEAAQACAKAQQLVVDVLRLMEIAAPTATAAWDSDMERVKVVVESQDASVLVGRDGRVLESLQFLATLMMSRGAPAPVAVQVDALSYWEKREASIIDQARAAIETVKATGKPVRLEPMDSSMRRLIHRTFAASPDVTTASEGEGAWRKIVIRPRKG